jgi:hypothetical protein
MTISDAIDQVEQFKGDRLAATVYRLERSLAGRNSTEISQLNAAAAVNLALLLAAAAVKRASAQIDVVIHAAGILYALPYLLEDGEVIESLSIGAANAGSGYDLVTNLRLAEFKFIHWQPKGNAVRDKTLFQDFYKLAREQTNKTRYLYLLQTELPLRFLAGSRSILKVLDRNRRMADHFEAQFDADFKTVGEFYAAFSNTVQIVSLVDLVPGFDSFISLVAGLEAEDIDEGNL